MKQIQRMIALLCVALTLSLPLLGCSNEANSGNANSNDVTIWSVAEDYRNEFYLAKLQEKFPDYNITIEYVGSSVIPAKVREEGENCTCDIIISEEYNYLRSIEDYLAKLVLFDYSVFLDEVVPESHKFAPELKNSGCIIVNTGMLEERDLPVPSSYKDLLDPRYRGLISMPSPKSSGTAYMFLRQLTNQWGEDEAFDYFEKLSENVLQYTASGAGPVNALMQGEAAIGLGITSQAVQEINNGADIEIVSFEEGSPYSMCGYAVLAKSAGRECVMDVFDYLTTDLCREDKELFYPEQIYKDFTPTVAGYPGDIKYGDMSNDTLEEKERLLEKWTFS